MGQYLGKGNTRLSPLSLPLPPPLSLSPPPSLSVCFACPLEYCKEEAVPTCSCGTQVHVMILELVILDT